MMNLCSDVLKALANRTLVTAESCTGGGIGTVLTAIPGSSSVFKGGVISYCDEVKHRILGVPEEYLSKYGAVSAPVACAMAEGVRRLLRADVAVSVTGLAGPGGDEYGNPVGTVFIGYSDTNGTICEHFKFLGDRNVIREKTVEEALQLILRKNSAR